MPMLVLKENKALKLTNVLSQSLLYSEDYNYNHMIEQIIERMKHRCTRGTNKIK